MGHFFCPPLTRSPSPACHEGETKGLDDASPYPLLGIQQADVASRHAPCNEPEGLAARCAENTNGAVVDWGASLGVVGDVVHGVRVGGDWRLETVQNNSHRRPTVVHS